MGLTQENTEVIKYEVEIRRNSVAQGDGGGAGEDGAWWGSAGVSGERGIGRANEVSGGEGGKENDRRGREGKPSTKPKRRGE